jgi:hypothetical protein
MLTKGDVLWDPHHFENPSNFCFHDGKLLMLDYGSRKGHSVIINHGERIIKLFDPKYSWKEEKNKLKLEDQLSK